MASYTRADGTECRRVSIYLSAAKLDMIRALGLQTSPLVDLLLSSYLGLVDPDHEASKVLLACEAMQAEGERTREHVKTLSRARAAKVAAAVAEVARATETAESHAEAREHALASAWKTLIARGYVAPGRLANQLRDSTGRYDDDWIGIVMEVNAITGESYSIGEVKAYARTTLAAVRDPR